MRIIEYKGASAAERGVRKMTAGDEWLVLSQTSYKRYWTLWTGWMPFRRRRHVVTFESPEAAAKRFQVASDLAQHPRGNLTIDEAADILRKEGR